MSYNILKNVITHKLRLVLHFLQNGGTVPTLAEVLTQLATLIEISVGNNKVVSISPTNLHEYLERKLNIHSIGAIHDGTGASTHIMEYIFDIPLCPLDKHHFDMMNPEYGFDGNKLVNIKITYPADGGNIDNRTINIYSVSIPNKTPRKVLLMEGITTAALSVGEKQALALSQRQGELLYELMFLQTSYLAEGQTTENRTILDIALSELENSVEFHNIELGHVINPYVGTSNTTIAVKNDDQYVIVATHTENDAETSYKLTESSKLSCQVQVAEAITYWQLRIIDLSKI